MGRQAHSKTCSYDPRSVVVTTRNMQRSVRIGITYGRVEGTRILESVKESAKATSEDRDPENRTRKEDVTRHAGRLAKGCRNGALHRSIEWQTPDRHIFAIPRKCFKRLLLLRQPERTRSWEQRASDVAPRVVLGDTTGCFSMIM